MKKRIIGLGFYLLAAALTGNSQPLSSKTLPVKQKFFHAFHLNQEKLNEVVEGETQFTEFEEKIQSEITIAGIHWFDFPMESVAKTYHSTNVLELSSDFDYGQEIKPPISLDDFQWIRFADDERDELQKLLEVEPGDEFNLDRQEIKKLQHLHEEIKAHDRSTLYQHAEKTFQNIIFKRFQSYYERGLPGVDPYLRDKNLMIYPGQILRETLYKSNILNQNFPQMVEQLQKSPKNSVPKFQHHFYYKQIINGRPAFVLAHRLYRSYSNTELIVERQFYVSHSYNAAQIVDWLIPHQGGTLVGSVNETFNDKIKGLLSGIAREVAESILKNKIKDYFQNVNSHLYK